jgi:hypothetical protein
LSCHPTGRTGVVHLASLYVVLELFFLSVCFNIHLILVAPACADLDTKMKTSLAVVTTILATTSSTFAQSPPSCGPAPSGSIRPSIASGYRYHVVATGLSDPRGILLDKVGNLLVVEQGRGVISAHTLSEVDGCVSVNSSSDVTSALNVRHKPFC